MVLLFDGSQHHSGLMPSDKYWLNIRLNHINDKHALNTFYGPILGHTLCLFYLT